MDRDRLVIPAPPSALVGPVVLLGLGAVAVFYGVRALLHGSEAAALLPIGGLLAGAAALLHRSASRPLVLDKATDRVVGYPRPLSTARKVVVREFGSGTDASYATELVFPDGPFRLSRAGWSYSQLSAGPDALAKEVGEFLGIPAETQAPFAVSFSFSKGFYLTERQARDAERAGVAVDPRAIK